ncbi:hypothetical protein ACWD25_45505 [Streptomyces sp. NPDC002920]
MNGKTVQDDEQRYGRAYALLVAEMVDELKRSANLGRPARRVANARIEGMRRGLLAILNAEHFMTEEYAASVVLEHVGQYVESGKS